MPPIPPTRHTCTHVWPALGEQSLGFCAAEHTHNCEVVDSLLGLLDQRVPAHRVWQAQAARQALEGGRSNQLEERSSQPAQLCFLFPHAAKAGAQRQPQPNPNNTAAKAHLNNSLMPAPTPPPPLFSNTRAHPKPRPPEQLPSDALHLPARLLQRLQKKHSSSQLGKLLCTSLQVRPRRTAPGAGCGAAFNSAMKAE